VADDVVRARRTRSRRGGAIAARQGATGKHQCVPGVAPGKEEGAEAHQRGGSMVRWRIRL
jgi:hypothetical protein